uniref:Uncharacterized protein n=1 Tax=Gopherus evgoodei TaxID=1825980 RepID=A0A8C4W9V8_9SAUR
MHSSKNKNVEKPEPFYRLSAPKQKTSAEIINEARNALRTLRTQRPFTPREDQRKLFGSASSRTLENRPPSTFSLHASSFESGESRPVSGTRLSPLDHKPKLLSSPIKDEDSSISFPKPPVDPMEVRKVSSARARLCRTASQGNLLPDKIFLPDESKTRAINGNKKRFAKYIGSKKKMKESVGPLLSREGELIGYVIEEAQVLHAYFALVFTENVNCDQMLNTMNIKNKGEGTQTKIVI